MKRRALKKVMGFTLLELMVASTIALLAITAAMAAFDAQNRALQVMDMTRTANASARDAFMQMEVALRQAGWGVDPRYAFDFSSSCMAASPGCRDKVNGSDQLVFLARNSKYQWVDNGVSGCTSPTGCIVSGNAATATAVNTASKTLTVTFPQNITLQLDQQVLATCINGQNQMLLKMPAQKTFVAGVPQVIDFSITPASVPYHDLASFNICHGSSGASLFVVDRFRYLVYTYPGLSTPWLVLDPMMDVNGDGAINDTDYIPVAKNVERLQVAYVLNSSSAVTAPDLPAGSGDWILGNVAGTLEEPDPTKPAPTYSTLSTDSSRFNTHPANIRAVRLTLVIRSDRADSTRPLNWAGDTVVCGENCTTSLSGGRYRRFISTSEVTLRNMSSSSAFIF